MYLYDNKQFSQINEIRENYNLISFQDIMRSSGAGVRPVSEAMRKMKIKPEVIILKPSNKTNQLYKREYLPQIVEAVGTKKRTDVIPEGYISKKQFAIKFGVNPYTVNNMGSYFPDFNKYAEYFYIDNIKTKYFLMTEESEKFYAEKVENEYFKLHPNNDELKDIDLSMLKNEFDNLQNYVSENLKIIPKLMKTQIYPFSFKR
jgi:hypothetical protein